MSAATALILFGAPTISVVFALVAIAYVPVALRIRDLIFQKMVADLEGF